jgi:leucyl-tRNA synthetase
VFAAVDDAVHTDDPEPETLVRLTHRILKGVTEDMDRFRYNTAISKLMVLSNEMRSALDDGHGARGAAKALVQMLAPLAPFAAEELWRVDLGHAESVHRSAWPAFDPDLAREERVTLVVQVDGKVRDRLEVDVGADEDACRELAMASENARRAVGDRQVRAVVVRPPRLVNVVTAH